MDSIDCDDERLQRRYTEDRRPLPFAGKRPVMDGIRFECRVAFPRPRADLVINIANLIATELKRLLTDDFGSGTKVFRVFNTSFSKRLIIPRDARLIFEGQSLATALTIPADHIASFA